jgi:hypothetical protein
MRIKLGAGLCLAILTGQLLPLSTPAHAKEVCWTAGNGAQVCQDDGTGPGSGQGSGTGGGDVSGGGSGVPGAVPPLPPPPPVAVAPPVVAPVPAPPVPAAPAAPAPVPAPGSIQLNIEPKYQAPQDPAPVVPVPDPNGVQSQMAEAPGTQAGITNPEAPADVTGTADSPAPQPTEQIVPVTGETSASPTPTSSNADGQTVIRAETASASVDLPSWLVLVFAVAGILIIGFGAAAYYFIIRPRQLGRRSAKGTRA